MFGQGLPPSSPTNAPAAGSTGLDRAPMRPKSARSAQSPLFTPPMDQGMNAMGGDPLVRDAEDMSLFDKIVQGVVLRHPELMDPLAQMQNIFRQMMMSVMTTQASMMQAPTMNAPIPPGGGEPMAPQPQMGVGGGAGVVG